MSRQTTSNSDAVLNLIGQGIDGNDALDIQYVSNQFQLLSNQFQAVDVTLQNQLNNDAISINNLNTQSAVNSQNIATLQQTTTSLVSGQTTQNSQIAALQTSDAQQNALLSNLQTSVTANTNNLANHIITQESKDNLQDSSLATLQTQINNLQATQAGQAIGLRAGTILLFDNRAQQFLSGDFQKLNGQPLVNSFKPGTTQINDLYLALGSISLPNLQQVAFDLSGSGQLVGSFSGTGIKTMQVTLEYIQQNYEEVFIFVNTNIHDYSVLLNSADIQSSQTFSVGSYGNREVYFSFYSGSDQVLVGASEVSVSQINIYGKTVKTTFDFYICLNNSIDPPTGGGSSAPVTWNDLIVTSNKNMQYYKIFNHADPVSEYDVANKRYVDQSVQNKTVSQINSGLLQLDATISDNILLKYNTAEFIKIFKDSLINRNVLMVRNNNDQSGIVFESVDGNVLNNVLMRYDQTNQALSIGNDNLAYIKISNYNQKIITSPIQYNDPNFEPNDDRMLVHKKYLNDRINAVTGNISPYNGLSFVLLTKSSNIQTVNELVGLYETYALNSPQNTIQGQIISLTSWSAQQQNNINYVINTVSNYIQLDPNSTYQIHINQQKIQVSLLQQWNNGFYVLVQGDQYQKSYTIHTYNNFNTIKLLLISATITSYSYLSIFIQKMN